MSLTTGCLSKCVQYIIAKQLPTLILGGGGYSSIDAVNFFNFFFVF